MHVRQRAVSVGSIDNGSARRAAVGMVELAELLVHQMVFYNIEFRKFNSLYFCTGCFGQNIESKACHQGACSMWSQWAAWSTCSNSCGECNSNRYRTCEPKNAAYRPLSPPYSPPPVSYNIPAPTQSTYTNAVPSPQYAVNSMFQKRFIGQCITGKSFGQPSPIEASIFQRDRLNTSALSATADSVLR